MPAPEQLVTPSEIPWDAVKGHALEECIYWILEALGAKRLDWRVGGVGQGTADGARDLECVFNIPEPSGDVSVQKWWVETKGRKGTVSPSDIKESILNVSGRNDVDVHLIVTNQHLSNPTKDWIAEWKRERRRPDIRVWERYDLERLVSRNPIVAIRLFPKSLTPQGRCEVMTTKFWEYMSYTDVPTLGQLWRSRHEIEWGCRSMFAALASECATGDLAERPWGSVLPLSNLVETYLLALVNAFYLMSRANSRGVSFDPVVEALAHLLTHMVARFDPEIVASLTEKSFDATDHLSGLPAELRKMIIDPVVSRTFHNAAEACLGNCKRVWSVGKKVEQIDAVNYWLRFREPKEAEAKELDDDKRFYMEQESGQCLAGLELSKENTCPMLQLDLELPLVEIFASIRQVIVNRSGLKRAEETCE